MTDRFVWIQDAYTATDRYPYAEDITFRAGRRVNYMRSSVKAVVDAYRRNDRALYVNDPERSPSRHLGKASFLAF